MPPVASIFGLRRTVLCALLVASLSACELCLPDTTPPVTDTTSSQGA
jgi:hypothetical protein